MYYDWNVRAKIEIFNISGLGFTLKKAPGML